MKKLRPIKFIILVIFVLLTTGCFPPLSLYPFYTTKDLGSDPDLAGTWRVEDSDEEWEFSKIGKNKYHIECTIADSPMSFTAFPFQIQDIWYLDLYPESENHNYLLLPTHAVLRIDKTGDTMETSIIDAGWLVEFLENNPGLVAYTLLFDESSTEKSIGLPLLTSATDDLQNLIIKIQNLEDAYMKFGKMERKSDD